VGPSIPAGRSTSASRHQADHEIIMGRGVNYIPGDSDLLKTMDQAFGQLSFPRDTIQINMICKLTLIFKLLP
jgi:hypothetical protein